MTAGEGGAELAAAQALAAGWLEERQSVGVGHLEKWLRCIDLLVAHD